MTPQLSFDASVVISTDKHRAQDMGLGKKFEGFEIFNVKYIWNTLFKMVL
jgi:hypothetical protein